MVTGHPVSLGDLEIGVSTSALQIEGGDHNNNWAAYAQRPGAIRDGSAPTPATDHWNRWREDTDLLVSLGFRHYRMGVEWSRIEPTCGVFDHATLDRYRAEIGALVDAGVRPLVTLHHFTNPLWFQGPGEWTHPASPGVFDRFVRVVVGALGDLVSDWVSLNEPNVHATQSYLFGQGPPGGSSYARVRKVLRHMAIGHHRTYRSIHELQPQARVGVAHHLRVFEPLDPTSRRDRALTRLSAALFQDELSEALLGGRFRGFLGPQPREVRPSQAYDYLGINYYSRTAVAGLRDGTLPGQPVNDLGWEIHPEGLITVARDLHDRFPGPIWVTENGTCDNGDPAIGAVERFRSRFIHDHLIAITGSRLPFERYYHWCFVDNWEWSEGMSARFGLLHLDPATLARTPKPSARFLSDVMARRAITESAVAQYVAEQHYPIGPLVTDG